MGTPIAAADLTWLLMDRPNNLMHVHGIMAFDELPPWEPMRQAVLERVVSKYRVMSQIPVHHDGHWFWEDHRGFSIDNHIRRVVLPDSDPATLRHHVSRTFSEPLDRSVPLWEMQLISGPVQDGAGGLVLSRWHHGLADGIRLVQLILGMCDSEGDAIPKRVGRDIEHQGVMDRVLHLAEHSFKDTLDYATHAGEAVAKAGRSVVATLNPLDLPHHLEELADLARHPVRLIDALTSVASEDNEVSNSWREVGRLLLHERADVGAWAGHPGVDKSVAWIEGIPLRSVQWAAKRYKATVNDVLMAGIALALTDYLLERGVERVHDLAWMMPVSLRPVDGSLPAELGNHFVVVLFEMPLGITDPAALVAEIHHRAERLKHSAEPAVAFGMQRFIAEAPTALAKRVTDYFSAKTIGQLSNVPGPRAALTFVGTPVRSMLGFVPTSGDQPLGVCLFSYNGSVSVGVAADTRMIPNPDRITELFRDHIAALGATS